MVFDPKREYVCGRRVTNSGELLQLVTAAGRAGGLSVAFVPSTDKKIRDQQFEFFCRLAIGDYDRDERSKTYGGNLTLVCDELHLVTRAGWAPASWGAVTLMGRTEGLSVVGISQRPSALDKDFFYQATTYRTHMLNGDDVITVAKDTGIPKEKIRALRAFEYLERDAGKNELKTGKVRF